MKKEVKNDVPMTISVAGEQEETVEQSDAAVSAADVQPANQEQNDGDSDKKAAKSSKKQEELETTLQQIKESATEDDAPMGTKTFRQIVGGDFLFSLVRHHILLILFVVLFLVISIGVRYQCEQDLLEISQLEEKLEDAKYKSMASSSNLTELCRQSNVLRVLRESQDTLLQLSDQPPFIITVPEN